METIRSKGFGDSVDKFTTATGIKAIVKMVAPSCGCEERKEWLNEKIKYDNI